MTVCYTPEQLRELHVKLMELEQELFDLMDREIECWRMFGITVTFVQDEMIIDGTPRALH